jgi:hypothetical protein
MSLPVGIIAIWHGAIVDIPTGWHLCDGTEDTPDLRDRFILGAGGASAVDATGGSTTHTHTGTTDGHWHAIGGPPNILASGTGFNVISSTDTDTFTTDPSNNVPLYYALAYIMNM